MKLKVGVFGAGHLGKIHIQQWQEISEAELIGFYDPNEENAKYAEEHFKIKRYTQADQLIEDAAALDIVAPTFSHFDLAIQCFKKSKHVFIEKPLAANMKQALELVNLAKESGVKCQVGHVERFNPALISLNGIDLNPSFLEVHRLAQYNPRGTDVSVVLDLMIHDLDIILALVKSKIKKVSANGVKIVSDTYDMANARLEFENGTVANVTASRISLKNMRKTRLFQKDAYIGIDFLDRKSEIVRFYNDMHSSTNENSMIVPLKLEDGKEKKIEITMPKAPTVNAIQLELKSFTNSILNQTPILVDIIDGYNAMDLAYKILDAIEKK